MSELLAAVCVLSLTDGHKAVLAALSDYRVAFDESFRFETLLGSLRLPDPTSDTESDDGFEFSSEEEGVWEARTATMTLLNALANCPESLEDRIMLREEFGRRGLNEVVVVRISRFLELNVPLSYRIIAGSSIHQATGFPTDTARCLHGGEI